EITTFDALVEHRRNWAYVNWRNRSDFYQLVAGIYQNRAHFLYELVQNAEDARAREVHFELLPRRLVVRHNGTRRFNLKDVEGVTGIGRSPKADDLTQIGRFG